MIFMQKNIQNHVLDTNWRSDTCIVQFNNAFFSQASVILQHDFNAATQELSDIQITDAYRDAYQHVPPAKTKVADR